MPHRNGIQYFCCLLLIVLASDLRADLVQYEITFESTWTEQTHPIDFPSSAHFSGTLGATHNENFTLWQPGELASPGIQRIAELGIGSPLDQEIDAGIASGDVYGQVRVTGLSVSPAAATSKFQTLSTHTRLSFASMIAPSPDWIVGAHDVELQKDGLWIPEITIDAIPYDAGTDSGTSFRSGNLATSPHEPIHRLTDGVFANTPPMGSFTLRLLSTPGDFNGSGGLDVEDVNILCYRQGETHERFELSGDTTITLDDVSTLVERINNTRPGDTNFDGNVDFQDFLTLSANFGGNGEWDSGDFDCNFRVGFADFLLLSEHFGFSQAGDTAAVPEPASGLMFAAVALGWLSTFRGRRRR